MSKPTTPVQYQNPTTQTNVTGVLDSEQIGQDSTSGSNVPVVREAVIASEQAGTNALSSVVDLLQAILAELVEIRYAMGKLTGEFLQPGMHNENTPNEAGRIV